MSHRIAWLAALTFALPGLAHAAGFEIPDNGTQALGRGGAFTAVADDGTAMQYNPAGLSQQSGLSFTLDVNQLRHSVSFKRTTPAGDDDHTGLVEVSNTGGAFNAPLLNITYARSFTPLDRFSVSVGAYGPSAVGKYMFPDLDPNADSATNAANAPNRYQLIKNDIFIFYPTLSVAYKLPLPFFASIGISGQAVYSTFKFNQNIYAQPSQQTAFADTSPSGSNGIPDTYGGHSYSSHPPTSLLWENPGWDANVDVDVKGKWAYTAIFGALVKLGPVKLGASFRPGYKLHADGTLNVTLPAVLTSKDAGLPLEAQVHGNDASLDLSWPSTFRGGIDVEIPAVPGALDVAADFTYETWSVVDEFVLTPHDITVTNNQTAPLALAPVIIPKHMQNSQSYRLGAQYQLPLVALIVQTRAGAYYEKSSIPEAYTSIDMAQFSRVGLTAGASIGINAGDVIGPLMLDLAGMYSPAVTRTVTDSALQLTTSDPYLAHGSIGNGVYTASVLILSAGIRGHFSL